VTTTDYRLTDRFTADRGTVFLSGIQALARLPIEQLRADRRAGLRTAALVTGYPGSPLGGFDVTVRQAAKLASDLPIVCRPAVNEEYAATAVMGSQLAAAQPDHRYDGVLGIWYGKAPGVDRATDAMRHAVYAGTSKHGGAVALAGDDPNAKSSTIPSSSAGVFQDLHMPLLYPADPAEVLDLGRHAVAMSRASGLWTALKIVADVADGTASVMLDPDRVRPVIPDAHGLRYERLPEGRLLTPLTLDLEREIYEVRYAIATEYASANRLNRVIADAPDAWIGVVASGITSREVREAFRRLGLEDEASIGALGIRVLKMQMPLPWDPDTMREFARGLQQILVIEEKQPHIELLVKDALYSMPDRPIVVGKHDEEGVELVPGYGSLDADAILPALRRRLEPRVGHRLAREPHTVPIKLPIVDLARTPFYCSGCPHNRSTVVPDDALVGAGIGCHTMALLMDPERVGSIAGVTAMGNEGMQWLGMYDFVDRDHFFQNLGDGTYFHSGQLAITAAIAANANITFKLLYNGVVAMTGGQMPQGQLSVPEVAAVLLDQGVKEVLITTDDTRAYRHTKLPHGVKVWSRDRIVEAQAHLATVPGVTVLIHEQACAAELRRQRKRGLVATPTQRVVINHRICEGCGDCGRVSNCLSVQPFDTPFGRKTLIDQTTCNLDYSCLEGDCPAFVTIETKARPRWWPTRRTRPAATASAPASMAPPRDPAIDTLLDAPLPAPEVVIEPHDITIRMVGIGGTGVVTAAQVIGTAAMLAGYRVRGLDQVGLSQKAGPVVSDLHLTLNHDAESNRLGAGQADVLLVFDALVAASHLGTKPSDPDRTVVVGSSSSTPPGALITHPDTPMPSFADLETVLGQVTRRDRAHWADAEHITHAALGDATTANIFVIGMALQAGALPLDPEYVEQALELNGVQVDTNLAALRLGRRAIADPSAVAHATHTEPVATRNTEATVEFFAADLVAYQDAAYAESFRAFVATVEDAEHAVAPASSALTLAVARNLYKLMAYKDEYEVARLMLDDDAMSEAYTVANGRGRVAYKLHPPLLRALGVDHKLTFGLWTRPLFRWLARGKRLRGTVLDPFRWTKVRRAERALPGEYRAAITKMLGSITADNLDAAVRVAELPDLVRGYEELKLERVAEFRSRLAEELPAVTGGGPGRRR